jgi:cell division septation protein DedD
MANMGRGEDEHYELDTSDEFHTYDATEGSGGGRAVFIFLALIVVVLAFGGVLYLAYQQGMREGIRNAPPLIESDGTPMKVAPNDPGGMEIPNTDKLIYDRLNGDDTAEAGVEHLLPRAEEPLAIEERSATPDVPGVTPSDGGIEVLPPAIDVVPDPETLAPVPASPAVPGQPTSIIPVPVAPSSRDAATTRQAPEVLPVEPSPAATTGNFVVQIAAFRDVPRAEEEFTKLQAAHPDLLSQLRSDIERADLGERGIYFRLRVGPFETKDGAASLCTRLKGRGQDCIVRER